MNNSNTLAKEKLNGLHQFFGSYFHQDWNLDATDPDDVVHQFINDGYSESELINLANSMEIYASSESNDAAVERALFSELGCYYMPSADGVGAKEWLKHVARLLRSS